MSKSKSGSNAESQTELARWLRNEMASRGWGVRETARQAGFKSHGSVENALFPDKPKVSLHVCTQLAQAFGVPVVTVLEMAELVPKQEESRETRLLSHIYNLLESERQQQLLWYAKALRDRP